MDKNFYNDIVTRLIDGCRIGIVQNRDGFLFRKDVQKAIETHCTDIRLISGSQWELRLAYELECKADTVHKYCFVTEDSSKILTDMKENAFVTIFSVSQMFPAYHKQTIEQTSVSILEKIYRRSQIKTLNEAETKKAIELLLVPDNPMEDVKSRLKDLVGKDLALYLPEVANGINIALGLKEYPSLIEIIDAFNKQWLEGLENRYYGQVLPSSYLNKPTYVGNVLPYLHARHKEDNIALVVVDGMNYWQYLLLEKEINKYAHVEATPIYSWIPSITMLSRQSLFRGGHPAKDYRQSPKNEEKLWRNYWVNKGIAEEEITYIYEGKIQTGMGTYRRLAYVTNKMDDKLHSSENYRELFLITQEWASEFAKTIRPLYELGYKVFITTDHGNAETAGWRALTSQEKTYLFGDSSRGKRHLIYNDVNGMDELWEQVPQDEIWRHDEWMTWKTNKGFMSSSQQEVSHGGCHFLEVMIPFAEMNRHE